MSSPNALRYSQEDDDDDEESIFTPRPKKPLPVNDNLINFSLTRKKEQSDRRAEEQARISREAADEDDEDEYLDDETAAPRRKRAGRRLPGILKRSRSDTDLTAAESKPPAVARPELKAVPENPEEESADEISPVPAAPENIVDTPLPPENVSSANANIAPTTPVLPPRRPVSSPPRMPGGGGSLRGVGNLPPISPANTSANLMPGKNEKSSTGPAWIAFLAATYFRRRGERRINRKIKKTNDKLEQTEAKLQSERQRNLRTEQLTQNQSRERPITSTAANPDKGSSAEPRQYHEDFRQESAAVSSDEVYPSTDSVEATGSRPVKAAEVFAASALAHELAAKEAAWQAKQSEKSAKEASKPVIEQDDTKEEDLDRRHEVKDLSARRPGVSPGAYYPRNSGTYHDQAKPAPAFKTPHNTSDDVLPKPFLNSSGNTADYKQSLRAGFLVGVAIIILGAIVLLMQR